MCFNERKCIQPSIRTIKKVLISQIEESSSRYQANHNKYLIVSLSLFLFLSLLQKSIVICSIIDRQIIKVKANFFVSVSLNVIREISCIKKEIGNLFDSLKTKRRRKFDNPSRKRQVKSHSPKNLLPT